MMEYSKNENANIMKKAFWAWFFIVININIFGINIFPPLIGFGIIFSIMFKIMKENKKKKIVLFIVTIVVGLNILVFLSPIYVYMSMEGYFVQLIVELLNLIVSVLFFESLNNFSYISRDKLEFSMHLLIGVGSISILSHAFLLNLPWMRYIFVLSKFAEGILGFVILVNLYYIKKKACMQCENC